MADTRTDTLVFARSLYLPEAIEAAAEAYGQVASVTIDVQDDNIVATVASDSRYGDRVSDAFCNHALFETIVRSREQLGGVLA